MAFPLAHLSDRQAALLRALWSEGVHIPAISVQLSVNLLPGENKVTRNAVTTWRRKFDLPSRRTPRGMDILHRRGVEVNIPPLGRLEAATAAELGYQGGEAERLDAMRAEVMRLLPGLRGKNLACTCREPAAYERDRCHGAFLLELANSTTAPGGNPTIPGVSTP